MSDRFGGNSRWSDQIHSSHPATSSRRGVSTRTRTWPYVLLGLCSETIEVKLLMTVDNHTVSLYIFCVCLSTTVFINCNCFCRRGDFIQERLDQKQFCVAATGTGGGGGRGVCHQGLLPVLHPRQKRSSVRPHHCHWTRFAVWTHGGKPNVEVNAKEKSTRDTRNDFHMYTCWSNMSLL